MYIELGRFFCRILPQKAMWKDGEFWTALLGGALSFVWIERDSTAISRIRAHFGDLLGVTSIVFGFALAALLFYIQAAGAWDKNEKVVKTADKIVDWHVWTIICLLFLILYILLLWSFGAYIGGCEVTLSGLYAFLAFQLLYCGFQILNHSLTVWWSFRNRKKLSE